MFSWNIFSLDRPTDVEYVSFSNATFHLRQDILVVSRNKKKFSHINFKTTWDFGMSWLGNLSILPKSYLCLWHEFLLVQKDERNLRVALHCKTVLRWGERKAKQITVLIWGYREDTRITHCAQMRWVKGYMYHSVQMWRVKGKTYYSVQILKIYK